MYKSKNISGLMSVPSLLREPAGSVLIYTVNNGIKFKNAQNFVQSHVTRLNAQIEQRKLIIVDPVDGTSQLAIQVTVLKTSTPKAGK